MAPKTKAAVLPSTMKELKDTLWKAADKLRGSMDASQYKDVILGLVFLKYVSDAFRLRSLVRAVSRSRWRMSDVGNIVGAWSQLTRSRSQSPRPGTSVTSTPCWVTVGRRPTAGASSTC